MSQPEREDKAFRLRLEGLTYREIGERLGVKKDRANDRAERGGRRAGYTDEPLLTVLRFRRRRTP
jgi:DNA-directed RNA polymerase specialized sigma24 family protein